MNNKNLKIIIIVLFILTVGLTGYIIYDKMTEKNLSNINNNVDNQINENNEEEQSNSENSIETDESKDSNNNNQADNESNKNTNDKEYTNEDFIRNTTIVLEEPQCNGVPEPLIAYINKENDLVFSGGQSTIIEDDESIEKIKVNNVIKSANAQKLYKATEIACDSFYLYYINNNNELYYVDELLVYNKSENEINSKGKKIIDEKVIEFLGQEHKEDGNYIKVLLENGKVKYIKIQL